MPNVLYAAADDFGGFFDREEVTRLDPEANTWKPERLPRPGDREIERVTLRRPPSTGTAIDFRGPNALREANLMIGTWRRAECGGMRGQQVTESVPVGFEIRFGDGLTFSGSIYLHDDHRKRDLRRKLKDRRAFAEAFSVAPEKLDALFSVFVSAYTIPA